MGVKAAHVDGEDHAARRDRIMAEFRDGAIQVVGNCDLISPRVSTRRGAR